MDLEQIGRWSFIVGLVLVLLTGFVAVPMAAVALFVVGLIVGFLNVTAKETEKFLLSTITLIVLGAASIQVLSVLGTTISAALSTIFASLIAFVGASGLVVAIKTMIETTKNK